MMLFGSEINILAVCKSKVTMYELSRKQFFSIAQQYFEFNSMLLTKLAVIQEGAENLISIDYVAGKTSLLYKDKVLKDAEALRVQRAVTKLKNAVMYYLIKNREQRKVPKLKDIIEQAIAKQKKQNEEKRKRKENITLEIKSNDQFLDES